MEKKTLGDIFDANEEDLDYYLDMDQNFRMLLKRIGVCLIVNQLGQLVEEDKQKLNLLITYDDLKSVEETVTTGVMKLSNVRQALADREEVQSEKMSQQKKNTKKTLVQRILEYKQRENKMKKGSLAERIRAYKREHGEM